MYLIAIFVFCHFSDVIVPQMLYTTLQYSLVTRFCHIKINVAVIFTADDRTYSPDIYSGCRVTSLRQYAAT